MLEERRLERVAPVVARPSPSRTSGSRSRSSSRRRSPGSPGPGRAGRRSQLGQHPADALDGEEPDRLARRRRRRRAGRRPRSSSARARRGAWSSRARAGRPGACRRPAGSSSISSRRRSASRFRPRSAPTKRATKSSAGWARIRSGVSYWASTPPSRRIAIRSPSLIASSMSWVTKITVLRTSSCRRRNSTWSRSRVIGSSAPNGSSISISGGSAARARARPTRWRWPPESCARIAAGVLGLRG